MKLAVGFITYNETSAKYLADFLPSLQTALSFLSPADYQVYVFDNSSSEQTANRSAVAVTSWQYLSQGRNLGFGRAYNILLNVARTAGAQYFLMINPDALLEKNAIQKLLIALEKDHAFAAVSPKILRWDFSRRLKTNTIDSLGLVMRAGLHFEDLGQGQEDKGQFDNCFILGPSGAAGLFRFSALDKISTDAGVPGQRQYFDEDFFMYKEDCDLAYRLFLAGYKSRLVPDAVIYHDRTAAATGPGLIRAVMARFRKSRTVRAWSHLNQHFIYVKYWKNQNFVNKIFILVRASGIFIFSLILEQFLLKQYKVVWQYYRGLTNIK